MHSTVTDYYDYTLPFYQYFWHKNKGSFALHYGFWNKETKNLTQALLNTNKFLAEKAQINRQDTVLDAGCGIGGSAIWLAKNIGAHVTGITVSPKQITKAKQLAKSIGVDQKTSFYFMDYLRTTFRSQAFTVIWAIESVCHAENKQDFLTEAYRLLKPNGRLIIADGLLKRPPKNDNECQLINDFNLGLALPNLASVEQFHQALQNTGFKNITYWDKSQEVTPSSKKLYNMCKIGYPIAKLTEKIHLTSPILTKNNLAGIVQYQALTQGLGTYGVFYAQK